MVRSIIHTIAYSIIAVQELNLVYFYPSIYWNTACLIVDSDGIQEEEEEEEIPSIKTKEESDFKNGDKDSVVVNIYEEEDYTEFEYEDLEDKSGKIKKKVKPIRYDKISAAISKMRDLGVNVSPPSINYSKYTFIPDEKDNKILYGLKGITRINGEAANKILSLRPFESLEDFINRFKPQKLQMINLIKSGAMDEFGNREELMDSYLHSICGEKTKLTLQNLPSLIKNQLIPKEYEFEEKIFNFNKYLRKNCKVEEDYFLDEYSLQFYEENFGLQDLKSIENNTALISQKVWDKKYKKLIEHIREWLQDPNTLKLFNDFLFNEEKNKYGLGSISKWEMDSIGFYYHKHDLNNLNLEDLELSNFYALNEEPVVESSFSDNKTGRPIYIYQLNRIAGTVIGKDKLKNIVTILTQYGIVKLKIYRSQFSKYDRQIVEKDEETLKKKVIEKSWFTRGNQLIVTGIRRGGDNFVPKVYKKTPHAPIELITNIDYTTGNFTIKKDREVV